MKTLASAVPSGATSLKEAQDRHLRSMGISFGELNARIARLAIGLGVSLEKEAEVARVMHQKNPASSLAHGPHTSQDSAVTSHLSSNPDRRMAQKMEELRGLLVLRYDVESQFIADVGVEVTRKILTDSEEKLTREGFKPGADGMDLNRLFKD